MITTEVADRVYRLAHAFVSCYLVEDDGRLLLVDAGLPAIWPLLAGALREHGRRPADIEALVLTHAHFDHTGVAARVQRELSIPVWAHADDFSIAEHPYRYAHENPRAFYPVRHPRALRILAAMTRAGALRVPGVRDLRPLPRGGVLHLPGSPVVVPTPGHTAGHCALHLPGPDALLSGDALVTLDPYTGERGPQIVAGAATADSGQALASLAAVAATGATTVLPGHGEPWTDGVASAVAGAQHRGAH
jgi:glyoxylase-like metal-dependent hydrolase (beta-lactamase superfamily II)